jgi:hypothetical protein
MRGAIDDDRPGSISASANFSVRVTIGMSNEHRRLDKIVLPLAAARDDGRVKDLP